MFSSSLCSTDSPHARGSKAGSPPPPWRSGTNRHRSLPPPRSPLESPPRPALPSKRTAGTPAFAWSACRLPSHLPRTLRSPRKGTSVCPRCHLQQCPCQRFSHSFACPKIADCQELSQLSMQTLHNCRELSPEYRDSVGPDGGTIAASQSGMTIVAVMGCPCGAPASVRECLDGRVEDYARSGLTVGGQ